MAGMTIGILVWAYTLLLPSFADAGIVGARILSEGPWGVALLRPQALLGLDLPPLVHGVVWSLLLNILAYVAFSLHARAGVDRAAAGRPVRAIRSRADHAELPALALVGDDRGTDHDGRPLSRRGAHAAPRSRATPRRAASASIPRPKPTSSCCAMPSTCSHRRSGRRRRGSCCRCSCASARSRPRRRSKLLDDANAAIHYNREILQTALDHVRQGIAVFNKDLQLICWNRQFGEILRAAAAVHPRRHAARRDPALQRRRRARRTPRPPTRWCASGSRATSPRASRSSNASPSATW